MVEKSPNLVALATIDRVLGTSRNEAESSHGMTHNWYFRRINTVSSIYIRVDVKCAYKHVCKLIHQIYDDGVLIYYSF
jgi:hypothetical protein